LFNIFYLCSQISINFVIVPIFFDLSDCALDSTAVNYCKTLDTTNGNERKTTSVILKRGRTILKRRYDPKKHVLRNSLLRVTANNRDLHKTRSEATDIVVASPNQNGLDFLNNSVTTANSTSTQLKEIIKLEDKLISGEEIELCPAFYVDTWYTKCNSDKVCSTDEKQPIEMMRKESSKFYLDLNNFKSDNTNNPTIEYPNQAMNKPPKVMKDYPKLCITVTDASDNNAMAKNSLLKSIRGIQSSDGESYGINISNSQFFVPKDYIFSGVECAMNDLKFEVDPEMGKLLQRSYSNPEFNTSLPINIETRPSSLDSATLTLSATKSISNCINSRCEDFKCSGAFPDTLPVNLKSKESNKAERRLFLKKRESKPSYEIIDNLLDEISLKTKVENCSESLKRLDNRDTVQRDEEELHKTKNENHETALRAKNEIEYEVPQNNQLSTIKFVTTNDSEIAMKSTCNTFTFDRKIPDTFKESNDHLPNNNLEIDIKSARFTKNIDFKKTKNPCSVLNDSLTKRKSYPLSVSSEISFKSKYSSSDTVIPPCTSRKVLSAHSAGETKTPEFLNCFSINPEKQIEAPACNRESQKSDCSNSIETNRLNRMRFLQDSLQVDTNGDKTQIEKMIFTESKLCTTEEKSKTSQDIADSGSICKKHILPIGRTFSLKEKFETIVEDVELRTVPRRRSQIGKSCDRKSLS